MFEMNIHPTNSHQQTQNHSPVQQANYNNSTVYRNPQQITTQGQFPAQANYGYGHVHGTSYPLPFYNDRSDKRYM